MAKNKKTENKEKTIKNGAENALKEKNAGDTGEKKDFDLFRFGRMFIIKPLRKYYDKLLPLYNKISPEKWAYLFFGVLTTVVSLVTFAVADKAFHLHEQICNAISFVLAVTFAYFVNKFFVFNSKKRGMAAIFEALRFAGARIASYGIECGVIAVFVTWLKYDASLVKAVAQVIVFILNYVFSKLIVFTNRRKFMELNGYWEEGYHYYIEIRDDKLELREYSKRIVLSTSFSAKETDGEIRLNLKNNKLSYSKNAAYYAEITALYLKDGILHLEEDMNVVGERKYELKKVDHGPFDNIRILDDEMLPGFQGKWIGTGKTDETVVIKGNELKLLYQGKHPMMESKIHIIEYKTMPGKKFIVSDDLTDRDFRGYSFFDVYDNMITTRMLICDAESPLLRFVKEGHEIPPGTESDSHIKDVGFRGMRKLE